MGLNFQRQLIGLVTVLIIQTAVTLGENTECIDDDAAIVERAQQHNIENISGCIDVASACSRTDSSGELVRDLCCETCQDVGSDVPENSLPPSDEIVDLYYLGGQSECVGGASVELLEADSENYLELQDEIDNVWFAGFKSPYTKDRFFVAPMKAGESRSEKFGPEISFGERIQSITGKRVIVVKYCEGGSNVHTQWNPDTTKNSWSKEDDNGTAAFLYNSVDFSSKNHLFINAVYTMRMAAETLAAGQIDFSWAGIIWVQGSADKSEGYPVWEAFGENTARVWNGLISEIGTPVPVIDTGSNGINQLMSGKMYATQLVEGCMAHTVEPPFIAVDDTIATCVPSPSDSCVGTEGVFLNFDIPNFYGYDPLFPEESKPDGSSNEIFRWYVSYPDNNHSEYEGMILMGRMLANAFVKEFLSDEYDVPSEYEDVDIAMKFPLQKCEGNTFSTADNFCWHDYRDEETSGSGCPYQPICVDDDSTLAQTAASKGYSDINGCSDAAFACDLDNESGRFVRATCCDTCSESGVGRFRKLVRGGMGLSSLFKEIDFS